MAGSFDVHPSTIDAAAPAFSHAGGEVQSAVAALKSAISGDSAAIGDDSPGQKFSGQYQPQKQKILDALDNLVKGLDSIDPALRSMATNYGGADSANSSMLGGG